MAKIVIIEDEVDLLQILAWNLRSAGHEVQTATHGLAGLSLCEDSLPDLVVLDRMLPDIPGTEVLRKLKSGPGTAGIKVLLLTACGEESDRITGFELGADDYVVKPFSVRELMLRISAILRRNGKDESGVSGSRSDGTEPDGVLTVGSLRIDRSAHRVYFDGEEKKLTALEFRLLWTLASQHDKVLSRAQLLDRAWQDWNTEGAITTRTVDTHIKRLREKIGEAGDLIETVRGVGYRYSTSGSIPISDGSDPDDP
jgi:two-component system phosphate regulon response regulator PhoB